MPFGPFALQWRAPNPNPPLPFPPDADLKRDGIERIYIPTADGPLEMLKAVPPSHLLDQSHPPRPALFFAHGGFGSAALWIPYMRFFAAQGFRCYAVSYRGHGGSWYPGYWGLYCTTRGRMAGDLKDGVEWVEREEEGKEGGKGEVVLIAHSSGAALAQWLLSRGVLRVRGFCVFAGVPGFGSFKVYSFWALTAPFHFLYRAFHPRYILATLPQVHEAFFTAATPMSRVSRFARFLSPYESMLWPMQALWAFVTGEDVLGSITGWTASKNGNVESKSRKEENDGEIVRPGMLVLAAQYDVLCTPAILKDAAGRYRDAFVRMLGRNEVSGLTGSRQRLDGLDDKQAEKVETIEVDVEKLKRLVDRAVEFEIVEGVAHHLQNGDEWETGAQAVSRWLRRLLVE